MKCTGISVGNSSKDSRTLQQFIGSEQAATPLGKLFIALTEETTWSSEYKIYASFGHDKPFVQVSHKSFLPNCSLMVHDDGTTVLSVSGVEDAIRCHINDSQEKIQPSIAILQGQVSDLRCASEKIDWDKARAAVLAEFPDMVGNLDRYHGIPNDLYTFGKIESEHLFVARKIGNDFTGGVAQIPISYIRWHSMDNGVLSNERHGTFWIALAKEFAANKLKIPAQNLRRGEVFVSTNGHWSSPEPYLVEKTVFRCPVLEYPTPEVGAVETDIIVEFGPDNLPAKMTVIPVTEEKTSSRPLRHTSQISDT